MLNYMSFSALTFCLYIFIPKLPIPQILLHENDYWLYIHDTNSNIIGCICHFQGIRDLLFDCRIMPTTLKHHQVAYSATKKKKKMFYFHEYHYSENRKGICFLNLMVCDLHLPQIPES